MSVKLKKLGNTLYHSEGRDFERLALPLIRYIWKDSIAPQPLRSSLDRSGVDILSWTANGSDEPETVIQCKGFGSLEYELGSDQIDQCIKSIASFKKSGLKANTYVLLYNRNPPSSEFISQIKFALNDLEVSGCVQSALLWNYRKLIKEAGRKVRRHLEEMLSLNETTVGEQTFDDPLCAPLEHVPYRVDKLIISPTSKLDETFITKVVDDPSKEILKSEISNLTMVLGKAGYGKTTTALRMFRQAELRIFYLSAAKLPASVNTKDTLISRLITVENLWKDSPAEDIVTLETLVGPQLDSILRIGRAPIVLVLDALDESIYFSRQGGIQLLFNHIRDYRVPVVLLAREEFWEGRQEDFLTAYGQPAIRPERRVRQPVKIVRLLDWQPEQMVELANRYRNSLTHQAVLNIEQFIDLVRTDGYEDYYGDIPRRPLFLRYILESVAEEGIKRVGRAELFQTWAVLKIRRDVMNPLMAGGDGRVGILKQELETETIIRLAFQAMKSAAAEMTVIENGCVELLPQCDLDKVTRDDPKLSLILDPTGLFLHSLLVPTKFTTDKVFVGFAHRTFQEFFLARYIKDNPEGFLGSSLPFSVQTHLQDIEKENLPGPN